MLFPEGYTDYAQYSVGQKLKLWDGQTVRVAGFYFNDYTVEHSDGSVTTISARDIQEDK